MWSFALAAMVVEKGETWLLVDVWEATMRKGFKGLRKGLVAARNNEAIDCGVVLQYRDCHPRVNGRCDFGKIPSTGLVLLRVLLFLGASQETFATTISFFLCTRITNQIMARTKTLAEQLAELDNPAPKGNSSLFRRMFTCTNKEQTLIRKRSLRRMTATKTPKPTTTPPPQETTTSTLERASSASVMSSLSAPDMKDPESADTT